MIEQLIENRGFLTTVLVALIGALVTFAVQRRNNRSAGFSKFIEVLSGDIATLNTSSDSDAYSVLKGRFVEQHDAFIQAFHLADMLRKSRLKTAWQNYYGENGEQDWWLPNEYSSTYTNQLKNTDETTKELAIHRLQTLVNICK